MMKNNISILAGARLGAKVKKKKLAEIIEITPQAYTKKEEGVTPFKDYEMLKIYEYLKPFYKDLTIDYLFFGITPTISD